MDNMRIRYGRFNNKPKNTMVTVRDGDTIYFGISRCKVKEDSVIKKEGKRIAKSRMKLAVDNTSESYNVNGTLAIDKSGVFGRVDKSEVLKLLNYFDNIDQIEYERSRNQRTKNKKEDTSEIS